jgi:hypothetical protein
MLGRLGLSDIGNEAFSRVVCGGEPYALFVNRTNQLLGEQSLLERGWVTEADLDARRRAFEDPTFAFVSILSVSTWSRHG